MKDPYPMDILQIEALTIKTHIGIHAWEQQILQILSLDIQIQTDFSTCHNQLKNTIDYDALCKMVTSFVESQSFALIETVAESVAQQIKERFQVTSLTVSVSKPHAIKNAKNVTVTIHR